MDYELLDSGDGRKLERFGGITIVRPAAQAIWKPSLPENSWDRATATFDRENGNRWHNRHKLPAEWPIDIDGIKFRLSPTDFGHLGIFPEQRSCWRFIREKSAACTVLNLFAYSGGSTLAAALGGASGVCHLDASQGMVDWARQNAELNNLVSAPIRWIVDDAHKFMLREIRRARRYDAIILDPPSFGRGAKGEVYKIERDLTKTLDFCTSLLSETPRFVLLSAHTPGITPIVLENLLKQFFGDRLSSVKSAEMCLGENLPSGCWAAAFN